MGYNVFCIQDISDLLYLAWKKYHLLDSRSWSPDAAQNG